MLSVAYFLVLISVLFFRCLIQLHSPPDSNWHIQASRRDCQIQMCPQYPHLQSDHLVQAINDWTVSAAGIHGSRQCISWGWCVCEDGWKCKYKQNQHINHCGPQPRQQCRILLCCELTQCYLSLLISTKTSPSHGLCVSVIQFTPPCTCVLNNFFFVSHLVVKVGGSLRGAKQYLL